MAVCVAVPTEASPVYQKIAAKLEKKGLDCTTGDKIGLSFGKTSLKIQDMSNGQVTQVELQRIISNFTMHTKVLDKYVLAFVHSDGVSHVRRRGCPALAAPFPPTRPTLPTASPAAARRLVLRCPAATSPPQQRGARRGLWRSHSARLP